MSILDRIRQLFSSENLTQQETSADTSRADGPDLGLWLDDGYRAMRSRHEWLINGQEGRPWRLYHGARERGTVAQMIERYSHLSIPKNALATVWDGKKWTFHPILDAAYADVMPDFLPLPGEKLNPDLAVVYSTPVGAPANGAFYGVLQSEGIQRGEELYLGMCLSTMVKDAWGDRIAKQHFFSYDKDYNRMAIREMSLQRLEALRKDIEHEHLDDDELMAIGWVDPFQEVDEGRQLWIEGQSQRGMAKLFEGFKEINKMSLRHVIGSESPDSYLAARYLGEAYYADGLFAKALYYLELAHYGLDRDKPRDPMLRDCMLRVRDFRLSGELREYTKAGEWTGRPFTRFGMVLEACMCIPPYNILSMAVLVDGNCSTAEYLSDGDQILEYDILKQARNSSLVQAFLALGDGRILVVEVKYRHGQLAMSALLTADRGLQLHPTCLNLNFGVDHWVSKNDFLTRRTAAAQRIIDGESLRENEYLLLGACENAHLWTVRAQAASKAEAWGDALYYLHKAYFDISERLGKEDLEHWDLSLVGHLCYQLGYVFSQLGYYEQALSYLYKLESSKNVNDLAELATGLCVLKDLRAVPFLQQQILDQRIKAAQKGQPDFKPGYLRYLRGRLAFALLDRNRPDEAKRELGALMCDPDRFTKEFAAEELQRLIDRNI
ncbi:MAG: hypothetical protein LIP09_12720 [Bacteroidales bacterium]|nr:hypothetical protein [Bacteroidales bacterium]